jgi:threonine dehydratase
VHLILIGGGRYRPVGGVVYDADVTVIGEVFEESLASAEQFAAKTGALLVHPSVSHSP